MDNHHKQASNLIRAAIDADALAKDLLKTAEINVAEATKYLRGLGNPYDIQIADLLQTLLSENKALREKCRQIEITAEMLADQYNPTTHVAVPRDWLKCAMAYIDRCDTSPIDEQVLINIDAMLAASEQEEG